MEQYQLRLLVVVFISYLTNGGSLEITSNKALHGSIETLFSEKLFNNKDRNLDRSVRSSRYRVFRNLEKPSEGGVETNIEQIVRLRLKRQLGDGGPLVDANASVLDGRQQSSGSNSGDGSGILAENEQALLDRTVQTSKSKWSIEKEADDDIENQQSSENEHSSAIDQEGPGESISKHGQPMGSGENYYLDKDKTERKGTESFENEKTDDSSYTLQSGEKGGRSVSEEISQNKDTEEKSTENTGKEHLDIYFSDEVRSRNTGHENTNEKYFLYRRIISEEVGKNAEDHSKRGQSLSVQDNDNMDVVKDAYKNNKLLKGQNVEYIFSMLNNNEGNKNLDGKGTGGVRFENGETKGKYLSEKWNSDGINYFEKDESRNINDVHSKRETVFKSGESAVKSMKNAENTKMYHIENIETEDTVESIGTKQLDQIQSSETGIEVCEKVRDSDLDQSDEMEIGSKRRIHVESQEIKQTDSEETGNEEVERKVMDSVKKSKENIVHEYVTSKVMKFTDRGQVDSEIRKKQTNYNINDFELQDHAVETNERYNGSYVSEEVDGKESTESVTLTNTKVENKGVNDDNNKPSKIKSTSINSEDEYGREMDTKVSEDIGVEKLHSKETETMGTDKRSCETGDNCSTETEKSNENIENKQDNSDNVYLGGRNIYVEGKRELEKKESGNEENSAMESEEDVTPNTDDSCVENNTDESTENMEASNTDFVERESTKDSNSAEINTHVTSTNGDGARDNVGHDESIDLNDDNDSDEHGEAKDSGNSREYNSEEVSYDASSQTLANSNSFEGEEYSGEDSTHATESYSTEEYTSYDDYDYFDYSFGLNPGIDDSKEDEPNVSTIENVSEDSIENTRGRRRQNFYYPLPYSSNYNPVDLYKAAIHSYMYSMYWPYMNRRHHRSSHSKKRLSNVHYKRSISSAQAKQQEIPGEELEMQYPHAIASSSLSGSYATAQSGRPFGGLETGEIVEPGEEIPEGEEF